MTGDSQYRGVFSAPTSQIHPRRGARLVRRAIAGAVLTAGIATLAFGQGAPGFDPREESPEDLPPGPGREETFYACTPCHNFKLVAAQGMSRERWDGTVTYMTERHGMPPIEGEDRKLILDYLATQFAEGSRSRPGWRNPFGS